MLLDRLWQRFPHFAMEIHPWVEHFDWLQPLFDERLEIADGRMLVPNRPGLGVTISEQARFWTDQSARIDANGVTALSG